MNEVLTDTLHGTNDEGEPRTILVYQKVIDTSTNRGKGSALSTLKRATTPEGYTVNCVSEGVFHVLDTEETITIS